jgi:DNA processing protein
MSSVKVLTLKSEGMPEKLRNIPDAPKLLYVRGEGNLNELLTSPIVAIVGSRKIDSYGIHATRMLAHDLASNGVIIASGLALGTDAIAHKACLEAGTPSIAVLASGIENLTPRTNHDIAMNILRTGIILSEQAGDYAPREYDFLIRNRLISGISYGVIVTQAAARSGSLNTARHALEQGRVVMAVPGPITNPLCEGPNNLLKMGAVPVTCAEDVMKALNIAIPDKTEKDYELLAGNEQELLIIRKMREGITDGEILAQQTELSAQEFNVHLTMLEIRGVIRPLGANNWTLG